MHINFANAIFFVEIKNSRISFFHTIRQMQKKHQKIPGAKLLLFTTYTTFSFTAFSLPTLGKIHLHSY